MPKIRPLSSFKWMAQHGNIPVSSLKRSMTSPHSVELISNRILNIPHESTTHFLPSCGTTSGCCVSSLSQWIFQFHLCQWISKEQNDGISRRCRSNRQLSIMSRVWLRGLAKCFFHICCIMNKLSLKNMCYMQMDWHWVTWLFSLLPICDSDLINSSIHAAAAALWVVSFMSV